MKKLIAPCLLAVALVSFVGCASDEPKHTTTTTSQETTVHSPVTTTTTDTSTSK